MRRLPRQHLGNPERLGNPQHLRNPRSSHQNVLLFLQRIRKIHNAGSRSPRLLPVPLRYRTPAGKEDEVHSIERRRLQPLDKGNLIRRCRHLARSLFLIEQHKVRSRQRRRTQLLAQLFPSQRRRPDNPDSILSVRHDFLMS